MNENDISSFENVPFEEQSKYGFINSLVMSVSMLIRTPTLFFSKMHINKGLKLPFLFLLIILSFSNVMNYIYISTDMIDAPVEKMISTMENDPELAGRADELRQMFSKEPSVYDILFGITSNFLLFYFIALYWHFIMKSLKVALNGVEATVRVFCYSSVVLVASILPVSNPFFNFALYIWWTFIMFKGISEAHEVSKILAVRAVSVALFATFIPLVLLTIAIL